MPEPARRDKVKIVSGVLPGEPLPLAIGDVRGLEVSVRRFNDDKTILVRIGRSWGGFIYFSVDAEQLLPVIKA